MDLFSLAFTLVLGSLGLCFAGTILFFWRLRRTLTRACDDTGNPITGQSPPSYSAPCPVCVEIHDPLPCPRQEMGSDGYGTIPCSGCCGFRLPGEPCAWLGCRSHNPPHVSRPAREVWGPSIRARQRIGLALLLLFAGTGPAWAVCISGQEGRDQQVEPLPAYPASAGGCSAEPQAPGEGAVPVVVVGLAVMVGLVLRRRLWIAALLLLTTGPVWAYNRVGANHGDRYAPQTLTAPRDPPAPKEATSPGVQYRYGGGPDVGATPSDRLVLQQAAQPSLPWKRAAVALLLLLAGWYARLRWGGGVLRVRGCEVFHWGQPSGWWVRRALLYRSDHPTVRTHYQDYDHRTLPGAIWAALRGLPVLLLLLCGGCGAAETGWALLGGLLSALVWLPLGAWGLLRLGWIKVVMVQYIGEHDYEWYIHYAFGWWVTDEGSTRAITCRGWWQALRDAWRLSRGKEVQ